jgi:hypothetical protein
MIMARRAKFVSRYNTVLVTKNMVTRHTIRIKGTKMSTSASGYKSSNPKQLDRITSLLHLILGYSEIQFSTYYKRK